MERRYDIALDHDLLWPNRPYNPRISILVAGCGSLEAAITAQDNPLASVCGIDQSKASLDATDRLRRRHRLENLELRQLDLQAAGNLNCRFDLIICFGVLHHLEDPLRGLRALASTLSDDGRILIAVYNRDHRLGLSMLQRGLNELGLGQSESDIALARRVAHALPPQHPARTTLSDADVAGATDSDIVDTLLGARERSYNVSELLALVEEAGLSFHRWFDNLDYFPDGAFFRYPDIMRAIERHPLPKQWEIVQLLAPMRGYHMAVLGHSPVSSTASPLVDGSEGGHVISRRRGLFACRTSGGGFLLQRAWHQIEISGVEAEVVEMIDGRTSVGDILAYSQGANSAASTKALLQRLWRLGHITFGTGS